MCAWTGLPSSTSSGSWRRGQKCFKNYYTTYLTSNLVVLRSFPEHRFSVIWFHFLLIVIGFWEQKWEFASKQHFHSFLICLNLLFESDAG